MRALRRYDDDILVVKVVEGLQLAVPGWMLDQPLCSQVRDEPKPRISVCALLNLCDLVDSQSLLTPNLADSRCASQDLGGNDAQPQPSSLQSTTVSVPTREFVGEASRLDPAPLPTASGADAAKRITSPGRGKERA